MYYRTFTFVLFHFHAWFSWMSFSISLSLPLFSPPCISPSRRQAQTMSRASCSGLQQVLLLGTKRHRRRIRCRGGIHAFQGGWRRLLSSNPESLQGGLFLLLRCIVERNASGVAWSPPFVGAFNRNEYCSDPATLLSTLSRILEWPNERRVCYLCRAKDQ